MESIGFKFCSFNTKEDPIQMIVQCHWLTIDSQTFILVQFSTCIKRQNGYNFRLLLDNEFGLHRLCLDLLQQIQCFSFYLFRDGP